MFRRAAKEDMKSSDQPTALEMAKSKNKAEARRRILGAQDFKIHSAKNPEVNTKEFFSSRKDLDGKDWREDEKGGKNQPKYQTDSEQL